MRKLVLLTGCLLAFVFAGRSSAATISFGAIITAGGITFEPSPSEGHPYGDDALVFNTRPTAACLESGTQGCADTPSNAPGGNFPSIQTLNGLRSVALNGVTLDSVTVYGVTLDVGAAGGGGAAGGLGAVRSASAVAALDFFGVGPDFWIDKISSQVQTAAFRESTDSPFFFATVSSMPEPMTLLLVAGGLAGLCSRRRRR